MANMIKLLCSLFIAAALYLAHYGLIDEIGEQYTSSGVKRALVSFAIARSLNGVISVAQGTEIAFQPAGIGINLTPGQILDPVNDLIERLSWVMLASSTSLGIQNIMLKITAWHGFTIIMYLLSIAALTALWLPQSIKPRWRIVLYKMMAIAIIIRFAIPSIAIASEGMYQYFLADQYRTSTAVLEETTTAIGQLNREAEARISDRESLNILEEAKRLYSETTAKLNIEKRIEEYKQAAVNVSEHSIDIIVVFVMQTIVFPLFFLWCIVRLIRYITRISALSSTHQ